MSIFNTTDPSDIDAVNEQMKQEAEAQEAARREEEQEQMAELARRAASGNKSESLKDKMDSPLQPEIESGLRGIFG